VTDATKSVVLDRELEEEKGQDSSGSRIRCPLCGWSPRKEDKWFCECGFEWNTFDTGGVCPACLHQWAERSAPRAADGRHTRTGMRNKKPLPAEVGFLRANNPRSSARITRRGALRCHS
jgi:hypothetical protein